MTKLSYYCIGLIEACCLAALISIPVLFNTLSVRVFDAPKVAILRSLPLIILSAWFMITLDQIFSAENIINIRNTWRSLLKEPLIIPILVFIIFNIISTVLSIMPQISFRGSYYRIMGLFTFLSSIIFFIAIYLFFRSRLQLRRLSTAIIVASIFPIIYGILQHYNLDTIPWNDVVAQRVTSTLGNPVFLAAFVGMIFPLTIIFLIEAIFDATKSQASQKPAILRTVALSLVAILQITIILYSGSRGPFLGWAAGLFFLFLAFLYLYRVRWLVLGGIAVIALSIGLLTWINIAVIKEQDISSNPSLRIGQILETSGSGRLRQLYWQDITKLIVSRDTIKYSNGRIDKLSSVRPLIGYGLETLWLSYPRYYSLEISEIQSRLSNGLQSYVPPDRAHNQIWDTLATTGAFGLISYQCLLAFIFYYGLKWLGLISSRQYQIIFWLAYLGCGLFGAVAVTLWGGIAWLGLGLPFGFFLGLFSYIFLSSVTKRTNPMPGKLQFESYLLLASLAGIIAHDVETLFSFEVPSTQFYFWVLVALFLLAGHRLTHVQYDDLSRIENRSVQEKKSIISMKRRKKSSKRISEERNNQDELVSFLDKYYHSMLCGIVLAILLVTISADFLVGKISSQPGDLTNLLMFLPGIGSIKGFGLLFGFILTWIISSFILVTIQDVEPPVAIHKSLLVILAVSFFLTALFVIWRVLALFSISRLLPTPQNIQNLISTQVSYIFIYIVSLVALLIILAIVLSIKRPGNLRSRPSLLPVFSFVILIAFWISYTANFRMVLADTTYRIASGFAFEKNWPLASKAYEQVVIFDSQQSNYYTSLSNSYLEQIINSDNAGSEDLLEKSKTALEQAMIVNPLDPAVLGYLADLYGYQAIKATDSLQKEKLGDRADQFYELATALSPFNPEFWKNRAELNLRLGKLEEALLFSNQALQNDKSSSPAYAQIGSIYIQYALKIPAGKERNDFLLSAAKNYNKALDINGNNYGNLVALAVIYNQLGDYRQAINIYHRAELIVPNEERWRLFQSMAELYLEIGDKTSAAKYVQMARPLVPATQYEDLQKLIIKIQSLP
jgi:tetratricopeptide (TPR) repeat protein/O-antigen ligase